jgi:hypothetical protein
MERYIIHVTRTFRSDDAKGVAEFAGLKASENQLVFLEAFYFAALKSECFGMMGTMPKIERRYENEN